MVLSKSKYFWISAAAALALQGCTADNKNHWDTITLGAGSASEANAAIHKDSVWPPYEDDTTIETGEN